MEEIFDAEYVFNQQQSYELSPSVEEAVLSHDRIALEQRDSSNQNAIKGQLNVLQPQ
jgi:hypothetical protein